MLVSCHEDFVGVGMLEPQWVFETLPLRLSVLGPPVPGTSECGEKPLAKFARTREAAEGNSHGVGSEVREGSRKRPASALSSDLPGCVRKRPASWARVLAASVWESTPRNLAEVQLDVRRALPCEW